MTLDASIIAGATVPNLRRLARALTLDHLREWDPRAVYALAGRLRVPVKGKTPTEVMLGVLAAGREAVAA